METLSEYLIELLVSGFGLAIWGLLRSYLKKAHGIKLAEYLDMDAIGQALQYGKKQAKKKLGDQVDAVEFENEILQNAFVFLNNQFPRWLKEYGIDSNQVRMWLEARYEDT